MQNFDIDEADVGFFAQNGYLTVERIATDEELEWLRGAYDDLISRPRSGFLDGVFDPTRSYGTTDEPRVGQPLLPERVVPASRPWVDDGRKALAEGLARRT